MEPGGGPSAAGLSCQEVTSGTGKKAGRIGFFPPQKTQIRKHLIYLESGFTFFFFKSDYFELQPSLSL